LSFALRERPSQSFLIASTLLIPGYIDKVKVTKIASKDSENGNS